MSARKRKVFTAEDRFQTTITGLNHDGHGVGRNQDKVVFVQGALPGEEVLVQPLRRRRNYNAGSVVEIIKASDNRVEPACEYFGTCGGCSLQHLRSSAQIIQKEQTLRDTLEHIGQVKPDEWLAAITGPEWAYRRKARLGIRLVPKKGGVLIGFREKGSAYITSLQYCRVLDSRFSAVLPALHELISAMSCANRIPQIEVAAGDETAALVFRHLDPLTERDIELLRQFGQTHKLQIFLQPQGPDSIWPLWPAEPMPLSYRLLEHDIRFEFKPTDFTQVNAEINQAMIRHALALLDIQAYEQVLDLFCGLGNFTLPIARAAKSVIGIEADAALIAAAKANAKRNQISNVEFKSANLTQITDEAPWGGFRFDKLLLDPPRSGASEVLAQLPKKKPKRIVYVSCNPATLARDANILVNEKAYRLSKAGVMDMFPQTSHIESIAVFDR